MKGSLRRLTVGDKHCRHSAHQRADYRYRFGQNCPKAEHQRKVYTQKGRADGNNEAGNQAQLAHTAHIGAHGSADFVHNLRRFVLRIVVEQIYHHRTQLAPVLKKIKGKEGHDNQAYQALHNPQTGLHKITQHRSYKAHRPVQQTVDQHIEVGRQKRNGRRILQHAVQILEIGFGSQSRQLLQELVHLAEERQNDEADNHKNKDTKGQQCQDNRHYARQLNHAVRHAHLRDSINQRIKCEGQAYCQQQRQ